MHSSESVPDTEQQMSGFVFSLFIGLSCLQAHGRPSLQEFSYIGITMGKVDERSKK
jgi:hypothetical protein